MIEPMDVMVRVSLTPEQIEALTKRSKLRTLTRNMARELLAGFIEDALASVVEEWTAFEDLKDK